MSLEDFSTRLYVRQPLPPPTELYLPPDAIKVKGGLIATQHEISSLGYSFQGWMCGGCKSKIADESVRNLHQAYNLLADHRNKRHSIKGEPVPLFKLYQPNPPSST